MNVHPILHGWGVKRPTANPQHIIVQINIKTARIKNKTAQIKVNTVKIKWGNFSENIARTTLH